MRRAALIMAFLLCLIPLASCADEPDQEPNGADKLTVIATIFPQYDLARAIVGDKAEVTMLLAPESESHTYSPSMADIASVSEADLFIYTGNGIDPWAEDMKESLDGADTVFLASAQFAEHKTEDGHDHTEHSHICPVDEHVWTSPVNAKKMLYGILEEIVKLDPENEDFYRANANAYASELDALDAMFRSVTAEAKRSEIIVADRFPFLYLTHEYGLDYTAALSGCSVGQEPSASVIADMISKVTEDGVPYVFIIENSDGKTAKLIAEATGCGILTLHSCHNVTEKELSDGVTYVDLMKRNAENLLLALN